MSTNKMFNVSDKVFAKIRGYPAWPAIISGVKVNTPSQQIYNVHLYGTGKQAECKSEDLFPYEENKSKLGKPNKRKYFAAALLQIEKDVEEALVLPENDTQEFIGPSNTSSKEQESQPTNELDKVSEFGKKKKSNSKTEKKFTVDKSNVSKGKQFSSNKKSLKTSDVKPEELSKKPVTNKIQVPENLSPKDNPSIKLEETLNNSTLEKASGQKPCPVCKMRLMDNSCDQNIPEVPKTNRLIRKQSKSSKYQYYQNNSVRGCDTSPDQNLKIKCSKTQQTSRVHANHAAASAPPINDAILKELEIFNNKIGQDDKIPIDLKNRMINIISYLETYYSGKTKLNKETEVDLLRVEVDLINYIGDLSIILGSYNADYDKALHLLELISKLQLNAMMLKKNVFVVGVIKKITNYVSLVNLRINEQETIEDTRKLIQIRLLAKIIYDKFTSLFTVLEGQTFQEVFQREARNFHAKTKYLSSELFNEIISDTFDD